MNRNTWELMNELEKENFEFDYEERPEHYVFTFDGDEDESMIRRLSLEHEGDFYRKENLSTGEVTEYGISQPSTSEPLEPSEDQEERTSYA